MEQYNKFLTTKSQKMPNRNLSPEQMMMRRVDTCNMDQCQVEANQEVGISLCTRHLQKAWAAYQIVSGLAQPPAPVEHEEYPDVRSIDAIGVVYIVRVQDMIKIGWTSNPNDRMRALKPDAILAYKQGTRRDEYKLQGQCMDHLVKGREWFDTSPAMIQFVKEFQAGKIAA